jgi:hypothetical protein
VREPQATKAPVFGLQYRIITSVEIIAEHYRERGCGYAVIRGTASFSPLRPHDRARPDPAVQTEVWPRFGGAGLPHYSAFRAATVHPDDVLLRQRC